MSMLKSSTLPVHAFLLPSESLPVRCQAQTDLLSLPESKDDHSLIAELTREFSRFGTVSVKIRRDGRNMPFAFCQYTASDIINSPSTMDRTNRHSATNTPGWLSRREKISWLAAVVAGPRWSAEMVSHVGELF